MERFIHHAKLTRFLFVIFAAVLVLDVSDCALVPDGWPDEYETDSKMREMMFPGDFVLEDERELRPLEEAFESGYRDAKSGFKNPFVFKREYTNMNARADHEKARPKHFFRNPFILKRDFQQRFPFILKRNQFQNPFVFRRDEPDEPSVAHEPPEDDVPTMSRMFKIPSIFKRMMEIENAAETAKDGF